MPGCSRKAARLVPILFGMLLGLASAAPIRPVQGPVILVRAGERALYLWDGSTFVAQLGRDGISPDDGLRALEATAITALAQKAKTAKSEILGIKVVYSRTGEVSPVYKTATFAGIETVCTLTARRRELVRNERSWAQRLSGGQVPPQVTVSITGKLPPPQQ